MDRWGDAVLRSQDALEVERVSRGHGDRGARAVTTQLPQEFDGFGQSELLAGKPGDEASAADFAAKFSRPVHYSEILTRHFPPVETPIIDSSGQLSPTTRYQF